MTTCRRRLRALATTAAAAAVLGLLGALATIAPAGASVGSDDFRAGEAYRGDFPDPAVLRVGSTYYAYATNTGGKLLPAMTSSDLHSWRARYSNTGTWWQNDALATAPRWAQRHFGHGKWRVSTWAPTVTRVGRTYIAAYAAPVSLHPLRMCISFAYAARPLGPFVDSSRAPAVCPVDQGAIDPDFYTDRFGNPYLLFKNEGIPGRTPTRLWTMKMNRSATGFVPGSQPVALLTTGLSWERNVIENPSMVRFHGRLYLFYSANSYQSADYATGYAICTTPMGPCRRPSADPLLATGGSVSGPGGPDGFVDAAGHLRLAYAAWDRGRAGYPESTACRNTAAGCNQRRLHVATLAVGAGGRLSVTDRG